MNDTSQNPKISVLMPVYNEKPEYLETAIKSILNQTLRNFELIIVDDGSDSSDCRKVLDKFKAKDNRIRIIKNEKNLGLIKTLNKGLKECRGEFIARMDSDDISLPQRLMIQLNYMKQNPDCLLAGSWAELIDETGKKIAKKEFFSNYRDIRRHILRFNFFTHSTWFFRRKLIELYDGYSERAPMNEDYDLLLRIIPHHKVTNIPQRLLKYRLNRHGISQKDNKTQEKLSLETRRRALRNYGYRKTEYLKLVVPYLVYWLVPADIKQKFLRLS